MKLKINSLELKVDNIIIGSSMKIIDTEEISKGLVQCKNHKTGLDLISTLSKEYLNNELSQVEKDTPEFILYQNILSTIQTYKGL